MLGHLFKAVVQVVLLLEAEMWFLTPSMDLELSSFQHRVAQQLIGRQPRRLGGESWDYPPLAVVMAEAGLEEIGNYVTRNQNTVAQYIVT